MDHGAKEAQIPKPESRNSIAQIETTGSYQDRPVTDQSSENPKCHQRRFWPKGVEHKVIASVSLSKTNQNVILTTMQSFTGQYLLDQKAVWEKEVSFHTAQLNQSWFKVVIHGVPVDVDLSNVPFEIPLYNDGIQVIGDSYWLTSAEKRQVQKAGSIVVAFATEKEASFCIRNRVYIAGISARVEKINSTPANAQCRKCQGFGI
ncbi:hypothetical protein K402DRAFT_425666 [Aulographum hederae CBS 113979]|uniref:Uncharacterized protein n=1 Tax=Aulographum hederae CBS 113979 TaxID=1176131 RepID=A0A6G1GJY0_9PEZI|nr:hypothetical protein K402DRAFT_425666 [Aulographum hederae CBS 113979]